MWDGLMVDDRHLETKNKQESLPGKRNCEGTGIGTGDLKVINSEAVEV